MAQHPYGQPAGPGPYWPPQQPPPPPRSHVGAIVVVVVLAVVVLVVAVGGAVWWVRSRSAPVVATGVPTSEATCVGGEAVTDPQFTFKVPVGWCVERNGSQVGLRTTSVNVITVSKVPLKQKFEQTALCDATVEKLGPYTKQPSIRWGTRSADTYTVTSGIFEGPVRCVVDNTYQYVVNGTPHGGWGTMDDVEAGVAQVLATWTWT